MTSGLLLRHKSVRVSLPILTPFQAPGSDLVDKTEALKIVQMLELT